MTPRFSEYTFLLAIYLLHWLRGRFAETYAIFLGVLLACVDTCFARERPLLGAGAVVLYRLWVATGGFARLGVPDFFFAQARCCVWAFGWAAPRL